MDYNIDFDLVQSQKLLLTPRLKQALEILEMNSHELFNYVDEQLEMNPVLEICKDNEGTCDNGFITTIEQMNWEHEQSVNEDSRDEDDSEDYLEDLDNIIANRSDARFSMKEYFPFVICDVTVKRIKSSFEVLVNEEAVPGLKINEYYRQIVSKDISADTRKFLLNKIGSGSWLIKCLEERKNMLRKTTEYIIKNQHTFFDKGKKYLKPLDIERGAGELNIHRYVLKAIINEKYLQCRWGSFELKQFFNEV